MPTKYRQNFLILLALLSALPFPHIAFGQSPASPQPDPVSPLALRLAVKSVTQAIITNPVVLTDGQKGTVMSPILEGVYSITVELRLENISSNTVACQTDFFSYDYHWHGEERKPDSTDPLRMSHETKDSYAWPPPCDIVHVPKPAFRVLMPGATAVLGSGKRFDVSILATSVVFDAQIRLLDNGDSDGLNAWTGIVPPESLRISLTNQPTGKHFVGVGDNHH